MAGIIGSKTLASATWEKLNKHLSNRILEIAAEKKAGKKIVGIFPGDWVPEELVHACKAIPLGLIHGGEPDPVEAAHSILPRFICAFARVSCGYGLVGDRPYYNIPDLYVSPVSCQAMRRVGDVYTLCFNKDVFKLGVPHKPERDDHVAHFKGTLKEFVAKLEQLTGNTPDELKSSIELYNRIRSSLNDLSEMRKMPNPPITTKEFIELNHASLIGDPVVVVEILETLVDGLKGKEGSGTGPRIMITGPCVTYGDWKVLDLLEELGAQVVIEDIVEGMRYYHRNIETNGDLMFNLADGYLRNKRPWPFSVGSTSVRSKNLFELAKTFHADGMLWYQLKYCECYDLESFYNMQKAVENGFPFLKLSSEYELIDRGAVKTRIEAFLETI